MCHVRSLKEAHGPEDDDMAGLEKQFQPLPSGKRRRAVQLADSLDSAQRPCVPRGRGREGEGERAGAVGVPRNRETPGRASYGEPGVNGGGGWVREREREAERESERERERESDKRVHSRAAPHKQQIQWAVEGYVMKDRGSPDAPWRSRLRLLWPSPRPPFGRPNAFGVHHHLGRPRRPRCRCRARGPPRAARWTPPPP